jgi:DNA repair protein RecO (recombination protein O)
MSICLFEMIEGFYTFHAVSSLTEHESNLFKKLIDLKFDNSQNIPCNRTPILLKILIDYYSFHLTALETKITDV